MAEAMAEEQSEPELGSVVFTRTGQNSDENMWDDTALIKAYDKAVKQVHNANEDLRIPKPKKKNKKSKGSAKNRTTQSSARQWSLGDCCRARYSEDGIVYPAIITDILNENECVVQYTEYGNEEEQKLKDLMLPRSRQPSMQEQARSRTSSVTSECSSTHSQRNPGQAFLPNSAPQPKHTFMPSFVPPPPPSLPEMPSGDMDEAFHSMLISWYMSGYHTGYYQGLRDAK